MRRPVTVLLTIVIVVIGILYFKTTWGVNKTIGWEWDLINYAWPGLLAVFVLLVSLIAWKAYKRK